jgi:hypothetical protein
VETKHGEGMKDDAFAIRSAFVIGVVIGIVAGLIAGAL